MFSWGFHTRARRRPGAVAAYVGLAVAALTLGIMRPAQAQLYAIGEDLWRIDLSGSTANATRILDLQSSFWGTAGAGNSLAYDNVHNQLLFSNRRTLELFRWDFATSAPVSLGNLNIPGFSNLSDYQLQGAATFYNGKYYLSPELATASNQSVPGRPWNFMVEVTLNYTGTAISSASVFNGTNANPMSGWGSNVTNGFGDFGDYAVDQSSGRLYGVTAQTPSPNISNSVAGFWVADLATPTNGVTVRNASTAVGQVAFSNGNLYRNNGTSSIDRLDTTTGNVVNSYTLSGYTDAVGITDMASYSIGAVPEPGTCGLLLAGLFPGAVILWRRRTA